MATATTTPQQGQAPAERPAQQQAGTQTAPTKQLQAEVPPPRKITDFASI